MQQSFVDFDPTVFHSSLQANQTVCGLGYFTDKEDQATLVRDALKSYRIMIFFKNYPQPSPTDLTMIYLWVVTTHMIKTIEKETTEEGAKKKLGEIAREAVSTGNDKKNFMGSFLKLDNLTETTNMQTNLKALKEILAQQLLAMQFILIMLKLQNVHEWSKIFGFQALVRYFQEKVHGVKLYWNLK